MKNMDIQNAFKIAQNRKRKIDSEALTPEAKSLKKDNTNLDDQGEKAVENVQLILDSDEIGSQVSNQVTNDICNHKKEDDTTDANSKEGQTVNVDIDEDDSVIVLTSENEQCSSELGSSMNKSMESSANTTIEDLNNSKNNTIAVAGPAAKVLADSQPKKQRRMSPQEAKRRTELREKQEKLREQKKLEASAKKQEEKDKKDKEKQIAKLERQQKREAEEREREKVKQEKKDQEEKEKQEKLKKKEEILKLKREIQETKAEAKKKKEEEKMKKEEEKMKLLTEKLKVLEEKNKIDEEKKKLEMEKEKKQAKTKQAFASFFVKNSTSSGSASSPQAHGKETVFLPFQVSDDMVLAPIIPVAAKKRFDKEQLDYHLNNQGISALYLEALKCDEHQCVRFKKEKKDKKSLDDSDIIEIDAESVELDLKPKLLQFNENIRPPYWGTFRKKSQVVTGRNPFVKEEIFDYDVDSDEEWDEGGPGESLNGTEDDESEDDYEVDNEFFVPHGYLSAEEEGEDENAAPEDPEAQQARLRMKEREFLSEHNKKTTQLKPIILGCFFLTLTNDQDMLLKSFLPFEAEDITQVTKMHFPEGHSCSSPGELNMQKTPSNLKRAVPEEALPYLLRLLHGNTNGRQKVIKEFQHFWTEHCSKAGNLQPDSDYKENKTLISNTGSAIPDMGQTPNTTWCSKISKRQLDMSITSVATWCKPSNSAIKKLCWWVKEEHLVKYGLTDLPLPNQWTYTSSKDIDDAIPDQMSTTEDLNNIQV